MLSLFANLSIGNRVFVANRALHTTLPSSYAAAAKGSTAKKSTKKATPKKSKPAPKPRVKAVKLPKQITSTWHLFNINETKAAKAALPPGEKISIAQLSQENAKKYHALSSSEKEALQSELEEVKAKFAEDYKAALEALTPEQIKLENARRAAKRKAGKSRKSNLRDPNKPKHPPNGFLLYLTAKRADSGWMDDALSASTGNPRDKVVLPVRKAGAEWKAMSESEKAEYNDEAARLKADYTQAMKAYETSSS